jgi:hypothetical protein
MEEALKALRVRVQKGSKETDAISHFSDKN